MKKFLQTIYKIIVSFGLRKKIRSYLRKKNQIPRVPLTERAIKNCKLVLNRSIMLSKLKKGGKVAEIGVDRGEFSELILKMSEPTLLHLIDIWSSKRYHEGLFEIVTGKFGELIDSGRVQVHRKLSTDAAQDFEDNYFDWIYIDTDHTYETTRTELIKFASKVKHDGIIAGHDYCICNSSKAGRNLGNLMRYGVIEAVHEFCVEYEWELAYLTLEPMENQSFAIRRIQESSKDNI